MKCRKKGRAFGDAEKSNLASGPKIGVHFIPTVCNPISPAVAPQAFGATLGNRPHKLIGLVGRRCCAALGLGDAATTPYRKSDPLPADPNSGGPSPIE